MIMGGAGIPECSLQVRGEAVVVAEQDAGEQRCSGSGNIL